MRENERERERESERAREYVLEKWELGNMMRIAFR